MNIAQFICAYLAAYQARYIFGYPGAAILPLMDAIDKNPALEWILMRNELAAALAASAQAKLTHRLSVCMATSGPGATNLITGLLDANLDRAPVLVITGLIPTFKHNLSYFQDIDQVSLLNSCCGLSMNCEHPTQIPSLLQSAIGYVIKNNRPAHLAIARDIQLQELNLKLDLYPLHRPIELMAPPKEAVEIIATELSKFENIIIAVGSHAEGAGPEIEKLAEKMQAPIVCSFAGKGIINENHPNYFGVLGLYGVPANQHAYNAIHRAECVLAFGVDDLVHFLTDKNIYQSRIFIQCEPDISCVSYQYIQTRILLGKINAIAATLTELIHSHSFKLLNHAKNLRANEKEKFIENKPHTVHQKIFFEKLNLFIDKPNTIIGFDIGDCVAWAILYLKLTHYQSVLLSNRLGTMGFCLPALIAAKLEKPDHLVVGICGDGGLQMVLGEINTAVQNQLNIFLIVFNNGVLQRVIAQQEKAYGTHLTDPDFTALAKSCGASGVTISSNDEIETKLHEAFSIKEGPVIINVICDPTIYAPMIS